MTISGWINLRSEISNYSVAGHGEGTSLLKTLDNTVSPDGWEIIEKMDPVTGDRQKTN
jgi:hypothetical protein